MTITARSSFNLMLFSFRWARARDGVETTMSGLSESRDFCMCVSPLDEMSMHRISRAHLIDRSPITEAIWNKTSLLARIIRLRVELEIKLFAQRLVAFPWCMHKYFTWPHNSLLGDSISALILWHVVVFFRFSIFWITGIVNAAVLPEPVRALISRSFPSRSKGMAVSWISVGSDHASCEIAWNVLNCVLL